MTIEDENDFGTIDVEYEKQLFDLKQLLEISKSLNSTLDYPALIDSILYTCLAQMKVFGVALFAKKTLDASGFSLRRNYVGFELDSHDDFFISEDHELVQYLGSEHGCRTMDDLRSRLSSLSGLEGLVRLDPTLIVPLKAKGTVIGIIVLGERIDKGSFDRYEREHALNIAVFASIAIHNAYLFEMTTTDMMTNLKMHHYFQAVLRERFERAAGSGLKLGLVMLDIDHFKKFNDTYGHTCGDAVIKNVARAIRENVRDGDIAARYGGEEFAVLLCDTEFGVVARIAERIRSAIASAKTSCDAGDLRVTVSVGVAMMDPRRDADAKSLIDRSDRALYRSKHEGRNRVSIAE